MSNKRWIGLLVMGCVVGLVYSGPTIRYRLELGSSYQGISLPIGYDQTHYTTLIREIYDGHYGLENGYLYEETFGPRANPDFVSTTYVQFLPVLLSGKLGQIIGLSLDDLDLLLKFLFPSLIFIVCVVLAKMLGVPFHLAIPAALLAVLFPQMWTGLFFFLPGWQVFSSHLVFMRPVMSQLSYLLFLLTLFFMFKGVFHENRKSLLIAGILLGVLHYVYFYYWTFSTAVLVLILVWALVSRSTFRIRWLLVTLGLSVLVGSWAIFEAITIYTQGVMEPHQFVALRGDRTPYVTTFEIALAVFIVGNVCALKNGTLCKLKTALYTSVAGAHILCLNVHVVAGMSIEPVHYELFVTSPVFTLLFIGFLHDRGIQDLSQLIRKRHFLLFGRSVDRRLVALAGIILLAISIASWYAAPMIRAPLGGVLGSALRFFSRTSLGLASISIAGLLSLGVVFLATAIKPNHSMLISAPFVFLLAVTAQGSHYSKLKDEYWFASIQETGPMFRWLQGNVPKESVIVAADATAGYLCTYTDKNAYFSGYAMPAVSSLKEWRTRVFSYLHFLGVEPDELKVLLDNRQPDYAREVQVVFWGDRQLSPRGKGKEFARGLYYQAVSQNELDETIDEYRNHCKSDPISSLLTFRADYVVESIFERTSKFRYRHSLDSLKDLSLMYSDGSSKVYKITR